MLLGQRSFISLRVSQPNVRYGVFALSPQTLWHRLHGAFQRRSQGINCLFTFLKNVNCLFTTCVKPHQIFQSAVCLQLTNNQDAPEADPLCDPEAENCPQKEQLPKQQEDGASEDTSS